METTTSIQNYQDAIAYERFMKTAYRYFQRDKRRGICCSEFHLLYHIENGYSHAGISYTSQLKKVQRFILRAREHIELTRHIPNKVKPIWEAMKLDIENSIETDYLSTTVAEIRTFIIGLRDIC